MKVAKPGKRLTKRQIKEDKLITAFFKATEYVQKNPIPFIAGVVVIVAILLIPTLLKRNHQAKAEEASRLLTRAQFSIVIRETAAAMSDLELIIRDYSNTSAARSAFLMLTNSLYEAGKYDEALEQFDRMLKKYSKDKMMSSSALAGMAACYKATDQWSEAAKAFLRAAEINPDQLWTPHYMMEATISFLQAADTASAQSTLQRIENEYPDSKELKTAQKMLAEMKY